MSMRRYEENAANCVRLARESNDAVLSFGLSKMAQAWLDLARKDSPDNQPHEALQGSRRAQGRARSSSRPAISRKKRSRQKKVG
jgi:hypothetical protein